MRIADVQLYRYRLPLVSPLSVGDDTVTERRGLLLRVEGATGADGWGEAAPLPGFSSEALADAERHGRRLADALPGTSLPNAEVGDVLDALPGRERPRSVRFAAESAVVELLARKRRESVVRTMGGDAGTVSVNALISDATADVEAAARRIREQGYRAVKLKVGRRPISADVARVQALHGVLGGTVDLRLDANRAWTVEQAVAFADHLGDVPLAYVEEPLQDPARLADLVEETGLPVAIDETTREMSPEALTDDRPVRAVVLKPTLLGGLAVSRRWAQRAKRQGAMPVVSASYESGVGLRMLVALAASLSDAPAGLSTYAAFESDVLQPRLPLDGADVSVSQVYASTVDRSGLQSVESVD